MSEKGENSEAADGSPSYDVGYGKPPVETRFKAGRSGNAKGRPKGSKAFATIVREVLTEKVEVRTSRGSRKMTAFEALLRTKVNMALKGDGEAYDQSMKAAVRVGLVQEDDAAHQSDMAKLTEEDQEILARALADFVRPPDDMEP